MQRKRFRARKYVKILLNLKTKKRNLFLSRFLQFGLINHLKHSGVKVLRRVKHSKCGRTSSGRICVRSKSSPNFLYYKHSFLHSKGYRFKSVCFKHNPINPKVSLGIIISSNNIIQNYTLPFGHAIGEQLYNINKVSDVYKLQKDKNFKKQIGNSSKLIHIPTGNKLYNIENYPGSGPCFVRSNGCFAQILMKTKLKDMSYAGIKLPSGKLVYVNLDCRASVGRVSLNKKYFNLKAGYFRKAGNRPRVRGVAMNPVDHPHGGGEGKKSKPAIPRNPWGTPAKHIKTLSNMRLKKQKKFEYQIKRYSFNIYN